MSLEQALAQLERETGLLWFNLWVQTTTPRERAIYLNKLAKGWKHGSD